MNIPRSSCVAGLILTILGATLSFPARAQAPKRAIAITIDDLPASSAQNMTADEILQMTTKLVATLHGQEVPAVGFVNERNLYKIGEVDDRIKALNLWLDNGFELGNHTFAHTSLNQVPLTAWEEEVIRGETVTRLLMARHKMQLRYFRYPYLHTGRDLQTRREAEAFLSAHGYQNAPITMDPWDWMCGPVYEDARKRGDADLQKRLAGAYLDYAKAVFEYDEKLSRDLFGYEPAQIILLHANWLEADHIGELLELLRKRGYRMVTLEEALSDGAYSAPDEYVGGGTGWINRWAITRGKPPQDAPAFPQWIADLANQLRRSAPPPASY